VRFIDLGRFPVRHLAVQAKLALFGKAELEVSGQPPLVPVKYIQAHIGLFTNIEHHIEKPSALVQNATVVTPQETRFVASEIEARKVMKHRLVRHDKSVYRHMWGNMPAISFDARRVCCENIIKLFRYIDKAFKKRTIVFVPENGWDTLQTR
jgi:hypothetical protein